MIRFFFAILFIPLSALALLPVDVSFLIVDIKYHPTRGAQICEIQHGINSSFRGNTMLFDVEDQISTKVANTLSSYYEKSWMIPSSISDHQLKGLLENHPKWKACKDIKELQKLISGSYTPAAPFSLKSYKGFVFIGPELEEKRKTLQALYPGIVFIDEAFSGCANDKLEMTKLLMNDPYTELHKPIWGHYHIDDANLVLKILNDIPSDLLVIKPLHQTHGNGVIILKREELKETFEQFSKRKKPFEDPAYEYWRLNKASEFIVEEFIESDPISVTHLEGKFYSPTIRGVYLLFYDNYQIRIECMGYYYNLPSVSVTDNGTPNQIYKSACRLPFYEKVDPELMKQVNEEIKQALTVVYQKRLTK